MPPASGDHALQILLIDDDPLWGNLIVRWLGRLHSPSFRVETTTTYDSGLARLLAGSFDACIVDHRLSRERTGLDLLREARAAGCDLPVLLLTATADEALDLAALRAGAADYLQKTGLTGDLVGRAVRYAVERQRAVYAQTESERRYRSVFENAPYGMCRTAGEHFTTANPALVSMLGYESAKALMAIDIRRDLFADPAAFERMLSMVRRTGGVRDQEVEWRCQGGQIITVCLNLKSLGPASDEARILEGVVEDITEKRRLGLQLRQAQKMEAIGRLAGGVAHDFNNLLTAILGYTETLRDQVHDTAARRDLEEIARAGSRAADLTRQLLAFSRKQVMTRVVCDLRVVVERACGMLRRMVGPQIQFVFRKPTGAVWIHADPGQIEQVLMNLVVNARDAMPDGGSIVVDTRERRVSDKAARKLEPMAPGAYGVLTVTDTGSGMAPETRAHLFEPFFTTKPIGKGTGLGLATVYGIVKQSGGFIWVDSQPGEGTRFDIYLPIVSRPEKARTEASATSPPLTGGETILIVEDEPGIRRLACRVLERYGYKVMVAESADQAESICVDHAREIDLLITDVLMPGSSGPMFAKRLRRRHPRIRVLYISGYPKENLAELTDLSGSAAFLPKPFSPDALVRTVRDVLDRPAGTPLASVETPEPALVS